MIEEQIGAYFDRLWPICRSLTGNGLRESLKILSEIIPLELTEVPTGTHVFDWEVPKEWNIREAYIITSDGNRVADFKTNNLHVVNYSVPVNRDLSFEELKPHLHYLEHLPEAIPYVTSYYKETWGFCLSYNAYKNLPKEGTYKVVIDSSLEPGSLTYGEAFLPGESEKEILISTYVCHPSMANNELSGPLVAAFLYKKIKEMPVRNYSYRFVFAPETIGIIAYLSKRGQHFMEHLHAGYVATCIGDPGRFHYKRSKRGNSAADTVAEHVLKYSGLPYELLDFAVGGSDERQYCSPGFNLPVGSLMRTPYQKYKEYHTSLDNKLLISFTALRESIEMYFKFMQAHELNGYYQNTVKFCEPQLGKRGLYSLQGGTPTGNVNYTHDILHVLAFADGETDLLAIADKRHKSCLEFVPVLDALQKQGILKKK